MDDPFVVEGFTDRQVILDACLASDYKSDNRDPIDTAILEFEDNDEEIEKYL
jgi:hypothetical protein